MSRPRLLALLLALVTLAIYLPVTQHEFVWYDDTVYVTENPMVQHGLSWPGIEWAFTSIYAANWHPLTWISHMVDCQIFGLAPAGHHLVNALWHAANSALLFLLLWRLSARLFPSVLVAGLFALHPVHVESVAWVAERKDVLSTCFALLALLSYVQFTRDKQPRGYWLAFAFFFLGLLAKPMLVTLPFVFLLLDLWPLQRCARIGFPWPLLREKLPFFALTVGSCAITFFSQSTGNAVIDLASVPLWTRVQNSLVALAGYLGNIFWPTHLAVIYPYQTVTGGMAIEALVLLLGISLAVWMARRHSLAWLVGWLWFLGMLIPVAGLVQVGRTAMADRYTYLPAVGIFIAVVFGIHDCLDKFPTARKRFLQAIAALLLVCAMLTERQLSYWKDSETLFRHATQVTANNEIAHEILGQALQLRGAYPEALAQYKAGLSINPSHAEVYLLAGDALAALGRMTNALAAYQICLHQGMDIPAVHNALGRTYAALDRFPDAFAEFAKAQQADPHSSQPHLELARVYFQRRQNLFAQDELRAALRAQPADPHTLAAVARCLAANADDSARDPQAALALALKANELSRESDSEVFDVLGMALAATGDFPNAIISVHNALAFLPPGQPLAAGLLQQRLQLYQLQQPWRESFRATNAPGALAPALAIPATNHPATTPPTGL